MTPIPKGQPDATPLAMLLTRSLLLPPRPACPPRTPRRRRRAVAAVKKLGGKLTLDESKPDKPVVGVSFAYRPISNDDLAALEICRPRSARPARDAHRRRGGGALKRLTSLKVLNLSGTKFGDKGLEQLKGLTALEDLDLTATAVTDAGLAPSRRWPGLRLSTSAPPRRDGRGSRPPEGNVEAANAASAAAR